MKGKRPNRAESSAQAEQLERFRETARQLECDEDQERFEKKLGKIAAAALKKRNDAKTD